MNALTSIQLADPIPAAIDYAHWIAAQPEIDDEISADAFNAAFEEIGGRDPVSLHRQWQHVERDWLRNHGTICGGEVCWAHPGAYEEPHYSQRDLDAAREAAEDAAREWHTEARRIVAMARFPRVVSPADLDQVRQALTCTLFHATGLRNALTALPRTVPYGVERELSGIDELALLDVLRRALATVEERVG